MDVSGTERQTARLLLGPIKEGIGNGKRPAPNSGAQGSAADYSVPVVP
ncbi:hypothetical protein IL54_2590 [Sphingobium sp. ba1]|nr:hypothetical protein IL54_2590 [Sphingobium sp. ba1]